MTWRIRLAEWLLRHTTYSVVSDAVLCDYYTILVEEQRVREVIERQTHLRPVLDLLTPRKGERMH